MAKNRYHLGAIDAVTGLVTAWNPTINNGGYIYSFAVNGPVVYVGGYFSSIGRSYKKYFAQFGTYPKNLPDFDGDGKSDVFWQHTTTGWTYIWFMDGGVISSSGVPGVVADPNWQVMN